jgi:nitroreductase
MDLMDAIKGRRSIRKFKPDLIPEEALQTILEAVKWAPSWANTQCWEIMVVKDHRLKEDLAKALPKSNPAFLSLTNAPVILVLCGKKRVSGFYKDQPTTEKGDWLMFDLGLAAQNLCLVAQALGLGTVIVGNFDHRKVAEILKVPPQIEVVVIIPLGYPAVPGTVPKRKEIPEFVFYEGYDKKE